MFLTFGFIASKLVPRYGRRVLEAGAIIMALGYLATVVALTATASISPYVIIPTLMLQAIGGGLVTTPALGVVLSRIAPEHVGTASGALSTAQQIGAALGVAIVGAVFFTWYQPGTHPAADAARHGFTAASLTTLVIALITIAVVFLLPKQRPAA